MLADQESPGPELTTHQELVVDGLDDDLLGRVLRHVEAQLELLVAAVLLDERAVQAVEPGVGAASAARAARASRLLGGGVATAGRAAITKPRSARTPENGSKTYNSNNHSHSPNMTDIC